MAEPLCLWCNAPSVALCDYTIGMPRCADGFLHFSDEQKHFTCDAPMCVDHKTQFGHVCDRSDHRNCDSMDHCPVHVGAPLIDIPDQGAQNEQDAKRMRRDVQALAARSRWKIAHGGAVAELVPVPAPEPGAKS